MSLVNFANFAQAAYATLGGAMSSAAQASARQAPSSAFAEVQAQIFSESNTVILQYDDSAVNGGGSGTSLSLTVFKSTSGNLTLAIRGTAEAGDFYPTNLDIGLHGAVYDQIVALYNWWQRASQSAGSVTQYRVVEHTMAQAPASSLWLYSVSNETGDRVVVQERVADASAAGELLPALALDTDHKLDVTGHSLAGHLAMAFAALFSPKVSTVAAVARSTRSSIWGSPRLGRFVSRIPRRFRTCSMCPLITISPRLHSHFAGPASRLRLRRTEAEESIR